MSSPSEDVFNFNVGMLGHVDSGKTSLAKVLSTTASTAAFDKNPQSRERGITLDLGFSSFVDRVGDREVQYTLVDCPGHASLIRTIIGGAQIIDLMILVVDVTKGMQTQTAECLVIGEITCPQRLIVALNKVDQIPKEKRQQKVETMSKKLRLTLERTGFQRFEIVPVAANPEGGEEPIGLDALLAKIREMTAFPERKYDAPFLFAVDHCFNIRGQGTVMTGTVLQGTVKVNDSVEIASIRESRKVKSLQMFRRPVSSARQGDRCGLCVTQFDAASLERGLAAAPGFLAAVAGGVVRMRRIPYFKGEIATKARFHMSLGHETVLARLTLFTPEKDDDTNANFDPEGSYLFVDKVSDLDGEGEEGKASKDKRVVFAILEFERPVTIVPNCKVLGSRLDADVKTPNCRLAFHGQLDHAFKDRDFVGKELPGLRVFKYKSKEGVVERANNEAEVICKGMFKKETNLAIFSGLKVSLSTGETGVIGEPFGQSGKFKVRIDGCLKAETAAALSAGGRKKKKEAAASSSEQEAPPATVTLKLSFKKDVFSKKMLQ